MALNELKCKNCGGKLILFGDEYVCENCDTSFAKYDNISNTYITNNNNVVKNFYGSSVKQATKEEKIQGYILRLNDAMVDNRISEARNFCISIINLDPYNKYAITIKSFIEKYLRGENGRYKPIRMVEFLYFLDYITFDEELISYINIFDLFKDLLYVIKTVPSDEVIKTCKHLYTCIQNLNNDYTKDFLTVFDEYINGLEEMNRLKKKDEYAENILKEDLNKLIKISYYLFGSLCLIIIFFIILGISLK